MFIVSDSDLDFNQPVVRVSVDRSKASDLGINMAQVGATLQTLLGGNYVNRFNLEGRSYQVIPQVPRGMRLSPESAMYRFPPLSSARPGTAVRARRLGSGRALGNEHEFAARAIWGLPHIQHPVAMDDQARLHLVAAAESESRI